MIITLGSCNIDLLAQVQRFPEPGETVLTEGYVARPGGKGANQAVAAALAGSEVMFAGCIGADAFGRDVRANFEAQGVDITRLEVADRPTGCALIWVDAGSENQIVVASGANLAVTAGRLPEKRLDRDALLVLQAEIPMNANVEAARRAREAGARTQLNLAPYAPVEPAMLADLDILILNEGEARALADQIAMPAGQAADLVRRLAREHNLISVITLGGQGALAAQGELAWHMPILPIEIVDTTGAGDAFCGIFAAALDRGVAVPEALREAAVGAALACRALGAQEALPTRAQITDLLAEAPMPVNL